MALGAARLAYGLRNSDLMAVLYVQMAYTFSMKSAGVERVRKTARLAMRLAPEAKKIIDHATALTGLGVAELALRGALREVEKHERIQLRGAEREAFIQALEKPPLPKQKLVDAMKRAASIID